MKKFETLGKKLSKNDQKKIKGGFIDPGGSGGYKCCWDHSPSNCSDCVPGAYPKCVTGASPVAC